MSTIKGWGDPTLEADYDRSQQGDEPMMATSGIFRASRTYSLPRPKCWACQQRHHKWCAVYWTMNNADCACQCGGDACDPCVDGDHKECLQRKDPDYDWTGDHYVSTNPSCFCATCEEEDKRRGY